MMNFRRLRSVCLTMICSVLVGFTGQEKFVELQGYLNGRSSAKFRRSDNNIQTVLNPGTKGEILESKKFASGNYGLRVKVMSGANAGQSYWVYYKTSDPDLALYDTAPASWGEQQNPASPEVASGAEVIRETPAIVDNIPMPVDRPSDLVTADNGVETQALGYAPAPGLTPTTNEALQAIQGMNEVVKTVPFPSPRPACRECLAPPQRPVTISRDSSNGLMKMGNACATIMGSDGRMGNLGNSLFEIMSAPKYKTAYTKDNALGKFCPNFNKLNETQRLQAWVWFWAALGSAESQCSATVIHPRSHNPTEGIGIWAMEHNRSYRLNEQGRDPIACDSVRDGYGQAFCAVDIMLSTQLNRGDTASSDSASYWNPIRQYGSSRMGQRFKTQMERFDLCFR